MDKKENTKYVKPSKICEQYDISKSEMYKMAKDPLYKSAVFYVQNNLRIDPVEFHKINEMNYNR